MWKSCSADQPRGWRLVPHMRPKVCCAAHATVWSIRLLYSTTRSAMALRCCEGAMWGCCDVCVRGQPALLCWCYWDAMTRVFGEGPVLWADDLISHLISLFLLSMR